MDPATQNAISQLSTQSAGLQSSAGSLMGFTAWGLVVGLLVSGIGYLYYRHGRRNNSFFTLGIGVALIAFPYFVTETLYIVLIAAGLMLFHYFSDKSD